jgi:hypothetical protein
MTCTINGKPYTEFDINKRCAELIKPKTSGYKYVKVLENYTPWDDLLDIGITTNCCVIKYLTISKPNMDMWSMYDPCNSPTHTWPIIDKCWDELMQDVGFDGDDDPYYDHTFGTRWEYLIDEFKCTKLIAACICYIELNE